MSILLSQQAAYAARTTSLQNGHLRSAMTNNPTDIYVLDAREMTELWQADQREQGKNARAIATKFKALTGVEILLEIAANYGSAGMDTKVLVALTADMYKSGKVLGRYHTTIQNGRTYIVFKGNQKLRKVITGTRYLATNTKMIQMGVGGKALQASTKGGFLISVIFSVSLHSIRWLCEEEYKWTHWLAHVSADIVKAVIAGAAGYFAGSAIIGMSAAGTVVILPLSAAIIVAIGVAWGVNELDKRFGITDSIVKALEKYETEVTDRINDGIYVIFRESKIVIRKYLQQAALRQIKKHLRRLPLIWQ